MANVLVFILHCDHRIIQIILLRMNFDFLLSEQVGEIFFLLIDHLIGDVLSFQVQIFLSPHILIIIIDVFVLNRLRIRLYLYLLYIFLS